MISWCAGLAVLFAVTSGCYGSYPHGHKRIARPTASADARLEMRPKTASHWSRCGDNLTRCRLRNGRYERLVDYTRYYFYYDNKEITLGEYQALTDPTYATRWDQIESKKGLCKLSIAPTVLYFVGAAASIVGFSLGASKPDANNNEKLLAFGGAGVAVFGGVISYPLGGYACRSAGKIAEGLEVRYARGSYEVSNNKNDERKLARMKATIDAFNRGELGRPPIKPTDTPTKDPTTEQPTEPTEPTDPTEKPTTETLPASTKSVLQVLESAGDLKDFSALLVESGVDREISTGGPFMVFAPSDDRLAKLKNQAWRKDKALVKRSMRTQITHGFFASGSHTVKTLEGPTFDIEFKPDGRIRRTKPTTSSIRLVGYAKNAAVYRMD